MILELTTASQSILSGIRTTLGSVGLTAQETIRGEKTFTDNAFLSSLTVIGTLSTYNDGFASNWNTAYTLVCANSGYWNLGGQLNLNTLNDYLSTTKVVLGSSSRVLGNLIVLGVLSALSSVVVTGVQNITIATSTTGIAISGNASFSQGVILSSNLNLFDIFATNTNVGNWNNTYTAVSPNSATWNDSYTNVSSSSGNWNSTYTTVCSNSANWSNAYTAFSTNSASYLNLQQTNSRYAQLTASNNLTNTLVLNITSGEPALKVVQIGTGEAFRVEDTTFPDTTPFVITSAGQVGIGTAAPIVDLDVVGDPGLSPNGGTIRATGTITTNNLTVYGNISGDIARQSFLISNFLPLSGGTVSNTLNTDTLSSNTLNVQNINVAGSVTGTVASNSYVNSNFLPVSGGTVTGILNVRDLIVFNSVSSVEAVNYEVTDPLFYFAANNRTNLFDIGVVGAFQPGAPSTYQHTGLVRLTDPHNYWALFDGLTAEPLSAFIPRNDPSFKFADLYLGTTYATGLSSRDAIRVGNTTSNNWQSTYTTVQNSSGNWNSNTVALITGDHFNAVAGYRYLVNTLSRIVTANLPTSPVSGTVIYFEDPFNYWSTNNFVVSANNKIGGLFEPLNCDVADAAFYLTFINTLTGWKVKVI